MKKQIALIAALILAGVMGYSWLLAHDAWLRFRAESQLKDQQIADREKQAAAYRESIERLKKQTQTTPQIVRAIPKVVTLPAPASTEYRVASTEWADLGTRYSQLGTNDVSADPEQTPSAGSERVLPETPEPQGIYFPPEDAKPLFDRLADCKAMESALSACQQNFLDMKMERDAARKAAKGGGFWKRLKSNAEFLLLGGVGGAILVCATGHCR